MTEAQLLTLLRAIRDLALLPYPFPNDAPLDLRLVPIVMALGEIAGRAGVALEEHQRRTVMGDT